LKLLALGLVLAASTASATPADELFDKGQASYQAGKYQDAIAQFKQAYELVHDPVYLFNIAQSYRKAADCTGAAEYYAKYLEAAPNAENKAKVQQWLEELRPCVDERHREQEAARANAAPPAQSVQPVRPAQPTETTVDRGGTFRIAGIALAGAGAVGLAVGITYGIKGSHLRSDIDAMCNAPMTCQWDSDPIQKLDKDGKRANTFALAGYIGGGIAVAAGAALYMLGRSRVEVVTITPTGGGASVNAQWAF